MVQTVGELHSPSGDLLLKMWKVTVAPGRRPLQRHFHSRFEITFILSGGGTYTTDRGEYPMEPGDAFVFAGNEFHCISDVGPQGLNIVNLHFEPFFLENICPERPNLCHAHSPTFENRIPGDRAGGLRELFFAVGRELEEQQTEYSLMLRSLLQQMMVTLLRNHGYDEEQQSPAQIQPLMDALRYIDGHFAEPISLQELAERAGMTPTYFSAAFKRAFNRSPWNYIINRRVEYAIHLLGDPDRQNMLDIATRAGFNNTANFNKQFKRLTGMTPTAYRNAKGQIIH